MTITPKEERSNLEGMDDFFEKDYKKSLKTPTTLMDVRKMIQLRESDPKKL